MKNDDIMYYKWIGENILAKISQDILLPNGGRVYTVIGEVCIKKGDAISIDFGRSLPTHTMSGKGFSAEFPFGKVSLHGVGAYVELNAESNKFAKSVTTCKTEFQELVQSQKERVKPEIEALKIDFIKKYGEDLEKQKEYNAKAEFTRKDKILSALKKMEVFFKPEERKIIKPKI